jgi:hypothetical protein
METTENNKIDLLHNDLREILMKYNSPEYGDCIIDEICDLFNYPLTNDEYDEVMKQNVTKCLQEGEQLNNFINYLKK